MAERTAIPEVDTLLEEFAARASVTALRRSSEALGCCSTVSTALVNLLRGRGIDKEGREAYLSGDEWRDGLLVLERISPDDFGYHDRQIAGHNSHVVALLDWEGALYSLDFSASQYGYREFPLVQRLEADGRWTRAFTVGVPA